MKKRSIVLPILIMMLMIPALLQIYEPESVYAESASVYELNINTTYQSYDITGDSKADKLSITAKGDSGYIAGFTINVNGTNVLTKFDPSSVDINDPASTFCPTIQYIKLGNGQPLLYIHLSSNNGYYVGGWVYKYEPDGMKLLLDTSDLINLYMDDYTDYEDYWRPYEYLDSVTNSNLVFGIGWTADPDAEYKYMCKYQNGKFVVGRFTNDLINEIRNSKSTEYNPDLAYMLMGAADAAYRQKAGVVDYIEGMGIENVVPEKYFNDPSDSRYGFNSVAYSIGANEINESRIVTIIIRGSYGKLEDLTPDWLSNFNLGLGSPVYSGWHPGFDTASKEVYDNIISRGLLDTKQTIYVITGHSRGAGVGNLLAVRLSDAGVPKENVFDYNFACPDTNRGWPTDWNPFGAHDNIFNINYCGDPVSMLPGVAMDCDYGLLAGLTWGKYGKSVWYADDWNNFETVDLSFEAHKQENYLRFLREKKPFNYYRPWDQMNVKQFENQIRGIISAFFCPVDVVAKNSKGETIAAVINGEASYTEKNTGTVLAVTNGDAKWFFVKDGTDVSFELLGTDNGSMKYESYQVNRITGEEKELKTFSDVQLYNGKRFMSKITEHNQVLVTIDENGNALQEVTPEGTETGIDLKNVDCHVDNSVYNGKKQQPNPHMTIGGAALNPEHYSISYKNNKNVGTATITVIGDDTYTGSISKNFKINPKPAKIKTPKASKKAITVKWKRQSSKMGKKRITGYQVQFSKDKSFNKEVKTKWVKGYKKTSKKIKKLASKKTYYVRIRTYMKVGGKDYYSDWSKVKSVTTKK